MTVEEALDKFAALVGKIVDEKRRTALQAFMESPGGAQFLMAPSGTRADHEYPHPGGMVQHALDVLVLTRKIAGALDYHPCMDSLITVCLFHDVGRATDHRGTPRWVEVPQHLTIRRERGERFELNRDCMDLRSYNDMTLLILTQAGVILTHDEVAAIHACGARAVDRWTDEPDLAMVVSWAKRWALR